ncbi:hypothetical protein ACFE04_027557 [Oxalis oulophora]
MALQQCYHTCKNIPTAKFYKTRSSTNDSNQRQEISIPSSTTPSEQFASLQSQFRRRLLVGISSASVVAVGANFGGITSFLLGVVSPQTARDLKLDVVYPIGGYSRCIQPNEGFEFIYPANWVGDQTLLYRAAKKKELERSLDPPPLNNLPSVSKPRHANVNEPVIAFGPPGSTGELNVSVIVSPVPLDFSIEAFGEPKEVGEAIVRKITGSGQRADVKGTLVESTLRNDSLTNVKYYKLEFRVESPSFQRHNIAVCCVRNGTLYTLNAQAPESVWHKVKTNFNRIADSFNLIT